METFDRDVVEETTTYLIDAAAAGDVDVIGFLLGHGADPNIASAYSGRTALLAAVVWGHVAAVDLLLAHGADVSAIDTYNRKSAMGYATANMEPAIVRSLLAAGAPAVFDQMGFSLKGGAEAREIVQVLVKHGADINRIDPWGRTPLMWASQHAELDTVRLMIELGADVNRVSEKNMNGVGSKETALSLARRCKRGDVVALLQQHGQNRDQRSAVARLWSRVSGS